MRNNISKEIEECRMCSNCHKDILAPLGCPRWQMTATESKMFSSIVIVLILLIAALATYLTWR